MRIDLHTSGPEPYFLGLFILCSGILTFLSGKAYLAAHWNASTNPELWQRAVRLEPGNAEYWRHWGPRQWDLNPAGCTGDTLSAEGNGSKSPVRRSLDGTG